MGINSITIAAGITLGAPLVLFMIVSLGSLSGRPVSERAMGRMVMVSILAACAAGSVMAAIMAVTSIDRLDLSMNSLISLPGHYIEFRILLDRLSIPYLILTLVLCGVTARFAHQYLHREPGYNRFFVLFALFVVGMEFSVVAGSMETLVAAWELVGLSSVLLIGFFHERPLPVLNSRRVWVIYRIGDLGLLFATVLIHHWTGSGAFENVFTAGSPLLTHRFLWILGLLLLLAAMGKSALVPLSNWLPRAMEGPTPSSAIFYGALSVHLGAFLLLRAGPVLHASPLVSWLVVLTGISTALHGTIVGRVQTDIKSALAYASLTQVGIIVAEIGCGLEIVPMVHMIGHASVRTLQFLRAPSLLHDMHIVENAMGMHLPKTGRHYQRFVPIGLQTRLYRLALERGYLETLLVNLVARPFLSAAGMFNRLEIWWVGIIGGKSR